MNLQDYNQSYRPQNLALADRWIRSRFNRAAKDVTRNMERYDLGEAARLLYDFLWDDLCDWYIELIKPRLYGKESEESKRTAQYILATTLRQTLELLHPFMPFITEEIWQLLPHKGETIMLAAWFAGDEVELDEQTEHRMNTIMETIRAIRNLRSEMNVAPGKKAEVILMPLNEEMLDIFRVGEEHIINLGSISKLTILSDEASKPDQAVAAVISGAEIYLPLRGLIDIEKELARLGKELENYAKEIARLEGKLNNAGFINKAPVDVVEKEKEKLNDYKAKKDAVSARIASLG
jgi:valyl-tRNA synthetase